MKDEITVLEANSKEMMDDLFHIRRLVFVEEQEVDEEEEYDEFEQTSIHLIASISGTPVGTCRIRKTDKGTKLERFAVLKDARSKNVGAALVQKSLEMCASETYVYLHAQIQVVDFYKKFGFIQVGDEFTEANIRHYKMEKPTSI